MTKADYNSENEAIKRRFRIWLQDANGYAECSVDSALAAIHEYEDTTDMRSFKRFRSDHAREFVRDMKARLNPATGQLYAKSTLNGIFGALRKFFKWLGGEKEYRAHLTIADAEYFRLSGNEGRAARAKRPKNVPSVEDVQRVIASMPSKSDIENRDRAVVAFTLLTAARVSAISSAKIKHVDLADGHFFQDAREVKTKRAKTFTSWFYPVGDDARKIVEDWAAYLTGALGFGPEDPLFPATRRAHDKNQRYVAAGLSREHWQTAQPIRNIFRAAFEAAQLPPPHPHLIRDTIAQFGMKFCTIEQYKAWSQNMGHDHVSTTLTSYGTIAETRQAELIRGIDPEGGRLTSGNDDLAPETIKRVLTHLTAQALSS